MATAKLSFTKLVVLVLAAAVLVEFSAAANHIVGDTTGWVNNPSGGATFYSNWASKQTFATGDILVFNYVTGQHNVVKVTKNAYNTCDATFPIYVATNGPTNITLNATVEYFFCTVGMHCSQGQKLAINVASYTTAPSPGAPSSPTTSPSPASLPSPTASPPPSPTASPPSSTTAPPPSSTASPPPPSPSSPGSPTSPTAGTSVSPPPPPASSAPPKTVAAFAVVLMSIAIGVMC